MKILRNCSFGSIFFFTWNNDRDYNSFLIFHNLFLQVEIEESENHLIEKKKKSNNNNNTWEPVVLQAKLYKGPEEEM